MSRAPPIEVPILSGITTGIVTGNSTGRDDTMNVRKIAYQRNEECIVQSC